MYKRILLFVLISLMFNLFCHTTVKANSEKEAKIAAKVKAAVVKLGTGPDARISIKLRDKSKIIGYVSKVGEDNFVVINDNTNTATHIPYSQVKQAKGKNNLTGEEIAILVGAALIILLMVFVGLSS